MRLRSALSEGIKTYPYRERLTILVLWMLLMVVTTHNPVHFIAKHAIPFGALSLATLCNTKKHPFWFLVGAGAGAELLILFDMWRVAQP